LDTIIWPDEKVKKKEERTKKMNWKTLRSIELEWKLSVRGKMASEFLHYDIG
jgi:hypothetical protein